MRLKLAVAVAAAVALVGMAWVGRRKDAGLRRDWKPADQAAVDRMLRARDCAGYQ